MAYPYRQPYGPRDGSFTIMNGGEARGGLMRRFTTNALPSLSPIGQQRRQAAGEINSLASLQNRAAPSERRIRHIERLLEQQRHITAELDKIDDETRREVEDGLRHERAVSDMIAQSEPTTPPEYAESLRTVSNRSSNRYSNNSVTSPPGFATRPNRASTQLTSPPPGMTRPYSSTNPSTAPSQSVPGSRRQSDDEDDEIDYLFYDSGIYRAAAHPNRNSMPVTTYDRQRNASDLRASLGALDSTSFFLDEEEPLSAVLTKSSNKTSPPDTKTYLQVQHTADGFPKLIRREENGELLLSGSSAAVDQSLTLTANGEQHLAERPAVSRHRTSLPPTTLSGNGSIAPLNGILASTNEVKSAANTRRSLEVKFSAETKRPPLMATPSRILSNGVGKGHASYSTNDIPTLKSIDGEHSGGVPLVSPSIQPRVEPTIKENNASIKLDRPTSDSSSNHINRQSQEFTAGSMYQQNHEFNNSNHAGMQSNGVPYGLTHPQDTHHVQTFQSPTMSYNQPNFYGGYGMQSLNNAFNNMNVGTGYQNQAPWSNQATSFQPAAYGNNFQQLPTPPQTSAGASRYQEVNRNTAQSRRVQAEELYANTRLEDLVGKVYEACKDQHGCRFLQKKLEDHQGNDVEIIFNEVQEHFQELMIDPFGNYLCQRLLEFCNDEQRTVLVRNAVPGMTRIALNQHGTRALQRMIEFVSTPEQTSMLIEALRFDVVQLIQDLNGNHVIQKCLNHLSAPDAQFIFDAVAANCVVVGTHRHGCCVVQRCVDHATGRQKGDMVDSIINNAFALVQDPFGNYVVQYILDLNEPCFTEPLCRSFSGNIAFLSRQKFSSNVMEKCIRCAPPEIRRVLISEINSPTELERMLRDSFANYVVQTAMEFADDAVKPQFIDNLRPIMPSIRNTPHGRRIQGKIQDFDNGGTGAISNANLKSVSPEALPSMAPGMPGSPYNGRANRMGMVGAPPQWNQGSSFNNSTVPNGFVGGEMNVTLPQRNQPYQSLNGNQTFLNGLYGAPNFQSFARPPPGHGHF